VIGAGAQVGAYSVLEPGAEVEPGVVLPPYSALGTPEG
jgi:hypothetical protein